MTAVFSDRYDDLFLRRILREVKTIAMVGASANWNRPSFFAMKYLQSRGYKVYPVNPGAAGQEILGEKVHASLADLPVKVDMVVITGSIVPTFSIRPGDRAVFAVDGLGEVVMDVV